MHNKLRFQFKYQLRVVLYKKCTKTSAYFSSTHSDFSLASGVDSSSAVFDDDKINTNFSFSSDKPAT